MITQNNLEQAIVTDQKLRKHIVKEDISWFFRFYFHQYIKYPSAPFHFEMFNLLQDESIRLVSIVAFRGSAKSTICTLLLPLWSVLGNRKKKHVVIVSQTQQKAQQILTNIKREFQNNDLLQKDFGPFNTKQDEWTSQTVVVPGCDARISAISVSESIRGIRHGEYRPDLIICDDIEDIQSTKTKDSRDKLWQFVNAELIPAGDLDTRMVFIGNLVHEDSVMMKFKDLILEGKLDGIHKEYPLLDKDENIIWTGKYPTLSDIETQKKKIGNQNDFLREYLLKIVADVTQIIHRDQIHYYDETQHLPLKNFKKIILSIDPAISEKHNADKTAIITAHVYGSGKNKLMYILPHPINKRMNMTKTVGTIKELHELHSRKKIVQTIVEDVAYQKSLVETLNNEGISTEGVRIEGDKHARLSIVSPWIHNGKVLFPKKGAEELIDQLVNFGVERYDDLVDSFTMLVKYVIHKKLGGGRVFYKSAQNFFY